MTSILDCARLRFEDPRIAVVVGNAHSTLRRLEILRCAPAFDVIMDDGSHCSSDVVESFARYFPIWLTTVSSLRRTCTCSYWEDFDRRALRSVLIHHVFQTTRGRHQPRALGYC